MNAIFVGMVLTSLVFAVLTGRMPQLSAAVLSESGTAVDLTIKLLGGMCLWSGVMNVAARSGLSTALARLLAPLSNRLFKGLRPGGGAQRAIAMSIVANLLGLGNAVTPLGIAAMREIAREEGATRNASDNMVLFAVLNTASFQLIPTTVVQLRAAHGSGAPLSILPAVWAVSLVSVCIGLGCAKLLARLGHGGGRARNGH